MRTSRQEFYAGVKAELPILVGVIPFGLIYGVLALGAGLTPAAAQAMSAVVFAGSAQFIMAQLFDTLTPPVVIVLTAAVVNLRHMLYSASVAPYVRHLRPAWKGALAYLLTDEAFAVTIVDYQGQPNAPRPNQHFFFLGAGLALWSAWQASTALGIFLGAQAPASWGLDFTLALTFIALLVPTLRSRPGLLAALVAGVVAVLAYHWPYKLGLMTAALAGVLTGLAFDRPGAGEERPA